MPILFRARVSPIYNWSKTVECLGQSHTMFTIKPGQVVRFQHLTSYKIANPVKLTGYNINVPYMSTIWFSIGRYFDKKRAVLVLFF